MYMGYFCYNRSLEKLVRFSEIGTGLFTTYHAIVFGIMHISGGGAGGNYPAGWNPYPPGKVGDYSCEDVGSDSHVYCATGEHPDLCNC